MNQTVNATLPIFHMPSMFLAALNGIRAQNYVPAIGDYISANGQPTTGCVYRAPNGNKCAFGHCLPDDMYQKSFEGSTASVVFDKLTENHTDDYLFGVNRDRVQHLADRMQKAHDQTLRHGGMAIWEREMKTIATEFGFPELYTEPTPAQATA